MMIMKQAFELAIGESPSTRYVAKGIVPVAPVGWTNAIAGECLRGR